MGQEIDSIPSTAPKSAPPSQFNGEGVRELLSSIGASAIFAAIIYGLTAISATFLPVPAPTIELDRGNYQSLLENAVHAQDLLDQIAPAVNGPEGSSDAAAALQELKSTLRSNQTLLLASVVADHSEATSSLNLFTDAHAANKTPNAPTSTSRSPSRIEVEQQKLWIQYGFFTIALLGCFLIVGFNKSQAVQKGAIGLAGVIIGFVGGTLK
ncbi:hypothetical protein [Rhizobium ruizarguesonis]|uniref:hypothetical protein n=1 Tax=Rhizobium ruizarguesonis TaxID=2081791 RepID=UPI0013C213F6|nr:hypothetical protein [Rhizobium ruizarguesonis]NEH28154.1 hypothetical protein [Rhizobium ruizarguesonis]NEK07482.1 hypothetical protein [Rhizobium ruizarguesonis]